MPWPQYPKTPEEAEARWDAIQEQAKKDIGVLTDEKTVKPEVKTEKKAPNPADFGAVPIQTKKLSPEDFGAVPISSRIALGVASRVLGEKEPYPFAPGYKRDWSDIPYKIGQKVTDVAGPEAGFAANVATEAIPALLGGGVGSKAAPALEKGAERLMQSALKPTFEQLKSGKAAQAIQTMFDEGINVSKGGIAKLNSKIAELNDQIADAIKNSPATVDKGKVASELQGTLERFAKQVNPQADLKAIEQAWTDFMSHPLLTGKTDIPVKLAQEMKQATYREVGKKYGELGSAAIESQKTLARGLKEGIAEAVPEISGLNKKESELINALNVSERRALMDANHNIGGLALLARNKEAFAAYMADKSSLFKSLVARMLHAGSERIPDTFGKSVGAAVGASQGQE